MSMNPCLPSAAEPTKKPALRPEDIVRADDEVKLIQAWAGVHQTGVFAEKTRQAFQTKIEAIQAANNLPVNGQYNAATIAAMMKSPEHKPIVETIAAMEEKGLKFVRLYRPAERPVEVATSQKSVDCLLSMQTLLPEDLTRFRYNMEALKGQAAAEAHFMEQLLKGIQKKAGLEQTGLYDQATRNHLRGPYVGPIKAKDLDALKALGILDEKGSFVIEHRVTLAQKIIMETPVSADKSRAQLAAMASPQTTTNAIYRVAAAER